MHQYVSIFEMGVALIIMTKVHHVHLNSKMAIISRD